MGIEIVRSGVITIREVNCITNSICRYGEVDMSINGTLRASGIIYPNGRLGKLRAYDADIIPFLTPLIESLGYLRG